MVARAGEAIVFLQAVSQGNRTRATMKAINAAPNLSSTTLAPTDGPASCLTCRLRVMPMRADQSAMCTINRHLLLSGAEDVIGDVCDQVGVQRQRHLKPFSTSLRIYSGFQA